MLSKSQKVFEYELPIKIEPQPNGGMKKQEKLASYLTITKSNLKQSKVLLSKWVLPKKNLKCFRDSLSLCLLPQILYLNLLNL